MSKRRILIIVQNLPVPFDSRVWQEALALREEGHQVSIICPKGQGFDKAYENIDDIDIYRHSLPFEAKNAKGYLLEYGWSLLCQFVLSFEVYFTNGFDVIHACNPPDTIFLVGAVFKFLFGKKFVFDHHDLNPELYEAKFGKRGQVYRLLLLCERLTFRLADISIATNNSYHQIALERGKMLPEDVFVVRSGPDLSRIKPVRSAPELKNGRKYMVGYVGVMGKQEGIQYLLEAAHYIVRGLKRRDVQFVLVGSGPELEALKNLPITKDLANYVTFTGRVSDYELVKVLSTATVCVNPDTVNAMNDKSTMNKIMEYMAIGKPIVQFDVTEGRVSAHGASLYAKPNDSIDFAGKIVELLDRPKLRREMGRQGKMRVENELAWKFQAPNLINAYDILFGRRTLRRKAAWYYHRFGAMGLQEIAHRIGEACKRRSDAKQPPGVPVIDYGEFQPLPGLPRRIRTRRVSDKYAAELKEQVEQWKQGQFTLLNQHWPACDRHLKWHLDPVSGLFWPKDAYCFDINYRHNQDYGDVKLVWELNRLQYLQAPAALASMRDDKELAAFCIDEITSWIDNNPPWLGINWASGIELALRAVSILVVTTFLGEYLTSDNRAKIWGTLHAHALWLERYPSKFSSSNNHEAAEGLALLIIGSLCPELPDSLRRKARGWKIISDCIENLILPDGTGAEQAIAYTSFTLEMFRLARIVAQAENMPVPEIYDERIASAEEALRWFTDSKGHRPLIGDDDSARVLAIPENANPMEEAPEGVKSFSDGGYTVGRHRFGNREVLIALDHGRLGYQSIAAHGHADALAVWLHLDGHPVLVDAGTYLYHGGGKWRAYFRGTAAHNTVCVGHRNSSLMSGHFNWSHKAKTSLVSSHYDEDHWQVVAEHDGYKSRFGVIHRRMLTVVPANGFMVEDVLIGRKSRHADIGFLLHPSLTARFAGECIEICRGENVILRVVHDSELSWQVGSGWYSETFGEKVQTTRILFSGTLTPGQRAVTKFYFV